MGIQSGATQEHSAPYRVRQARLNNRSLQKNHKGFKPAIRCQRYPLQPNDLIRHEGLLCRVKGVFNYGTWARFTATNGKTINSNVSNVSLVKHGKGFAFEMSDSSPTKRKESSWPER
ncbi:MAG: hypothetical protein ACFFB3_19660 [Candidatus Hodarchaeota archaeon]